MPLCCTGTAWCAALGRPCAACCVFQNTDTPSKTRNRKIRTLGGMQSDRRLFGQVTASAQHDLPSERALHPRLAGLGTRRPAGPQIKETRRLSGHLVTAPDSRPDPATGCVAGTRSPWVRHRVSAPDTTEYELNHPHARENASQALPRTDTSPIPHAFDPGRLTNDHH